MLLHGDGADRHLQLLHYLATGFRQEMELGCLTTSKRSSFDLFKHAKNTLVGKYKSAF